MIQERDISAQNSLVSKKFLETIKAVDGKVQNLVYHQLRLESVLRSLKTSQHYMLENYLLPPLDGIYRCRVVYDENELDVTYFPYEKRSVGSLKIVYNDEIEYSQKYLDRELLETLLELRDGCDDILIVKSGLIRDTSIANVAFYDGEKWSTPKRPLLKGTTRQRYLDSAKIIQRDIFVDDLKGFTKVALMNAMIDFDIIRKDNIEEIIC